MTSVPGRTLHPITVAPSGAHRGRLTLWLMLAALAVRLFVIFPGPFERPVEALTNRADLRNYYWPAQAVLKGENPYVLWAAGQSAENRADMTPLELLIYVATVSVWNDPRAIQLLFSACDVLNIFLLGVLLSHSPVKRPFQLFYALGPLTLYNFALVPEDKTIVLTLTFILFILIRVPTGTRMQVGPIRVDSGLLTVVVAGLIAAFKWLSVFYIIPLLWFTSPTRRSMITHAFTFAIVLALAHLPWLPTWWYVYVFRSARTATPLHISPAVLLNALGAFDKTALVFALVISLVCVYALFLLRRIDIFEAIALSSMAGILWTPDMDPVHLSLVVIGLLLILNWARPRRTAAIWLFSLVVAGVYAISTHSRLARYGVPELRALTGDYGSLQMVILSYLLFLLVIILYVRDKVLGLPVGQRILDPAPDLPEPSLAGEPAGSPHPVRT